MDLPTGGRRRPVEVAQRVAASLLGLLLGLGSPGVTVHASSPAQGGATLDGWGGVHPFGGLSLSTTGAPYWQGWDIARGLAVREDGTGGWTLDGWGAIHAWGGAPAVSTPHEWPGWDIARDAVFTTRDAQGITDGRQGYLLDGFGGLWPWGGAPALSAPYPGRDIARGIAIHLNGTGVPDGGWMLYRDGTVHAFGAAPALTVALPAANVFLKLRMSGVGEYVVARWGIVSLFGSGVSPYWSGYSDWGSWDIVRDIALVGNDNPSAQTQPVSAAAQARYAQAVAPRGGVVLDGWGGIHPFGGLTLTSSGYPYWQGWDIARSVVVREDGSGGWTLDGWGAIHSWGAAPPISAPTYWPGWDIARALVVTSRDSRGVLDGRQGYVLDGWGGIHAWGGAPPLPGPYWPGFDIARGLEIHLGAGGAPDGAWVMDAAGKVRTVGAAPDPGAGVAHPGVPLFRQLHAANGGLYEVGRFGVTAPLSDIGSPYWDGYLDWGGRDMTRDVVLVNPTSPEPTSPTPPSSATAQTAFAAAVGGTYGLSAPLYRQIHPLDCEAASLQMALAARGTSVSQDWELAVMGSDLRRAVRDGYGNILQWGDPYATFVGNVNAAEYNATGYGVYYPPLVGIAHATGHNALGAENWDVGDLLELVALGYPAVVELSFRMAPAATRYWTAWDGRQVPYILNDHVNTMIAVNFAAQTVTLNDPYDATVRTYTMAQFLGAFRYINNMATVIS